jgi:hypothetical protein
MHSKSGICTLLFVVAIVGCSAKPPACADESTRKTVENLVLDLAAKMLKGDIERDTEGLVEPELAAARVSLHDIVDNGIDAAAKRQTCAATLRAEASSRRLDGPVNYTTQLTLGDQAGKFVLELENATAYAAFIRNEVVGAAHGKAGLGHWRGTYHCGTSKAAASLATSDAFNAEVTLVVSPPSKDTGSFSTATLERAAPDGGTETLTGAFMQHLDLRGSGRGPKGERWKTSFRLVRNGDELTGDGDMRDNDGNFLRPCSLDLKRTRERAAAAPASQDVKVEMAADLAGRYRGQGEGNVELNIDALAPDGSHPATLSTHSPPPSGCGGAATGKVLLNPLRFVAEDGGERCEVTITKTGSRLEVEEGRGCSYFHGAACGFSATLERVK